MKKEIFTGLLERHVVEPRTAPGNPAFRLRSYGDNAGSTPHPDSVFRAYLHH